MSLNSDRGMAALGEVNGTKRFKNNPSVITVSKDGASAMEVKVGDTVYVKGRVTAVYADQIYVMFNGVGSMRFYRVDILDVEPKQSGDRRSLSKSSEVA